MPHNWKCRSHDSQALGFPALLWLAGLWTHCQFIWADGAGGTQEHLVTLLSQESWNWGAVLSGLTLLWNDVNEVLIISNKLLKKFSSLGNVSICIAQGSALHFPCLLLGELSMDRMATTLWLPELRWGSTAGTWGKTAQGSCRQCLGLELVYCTGLHCQWNGNYTRNILVSQGSLYVGVECIYYLCVYKQAKVRHIFIYINVTFGAM